MAETVRPIPDAVAVLREAREILAIPGMAFDSPTARRLIGDLVWLLTDPASDTQRAFLLLQEFVDGLAGSGFPATKDRFADPSAAAITAAKQILAGLQK